MMTGLGAGAALMPPMVQRLIAGYGWRTTFTIVGCAILIIPIPVVALFLKENPRRLGLLPDGGFDTVLAPWRPEGFTWREIRRCPAFWLIIVAFGLMSVSVHACIVYLPEILGRSGASADAAALGSSVAGLAVLAGRIGTGYFLDRYFGPYVALLVFANSAFGIALLLWTGGAGPAALLGAFLVGLGFGAEVDLISYLMGRYFGLRSLGTAFGFGFGVFVLAGGFGPLIMGFAFEKTGSYLAPLTGFLLATGLAAAMVGNLGPYNFGVNEEAKTPSITGPEVNA
jgi:cyanate permease